MMTPPLPKPPFQLAPTVGRLRRKVVAAALALLALQSTPHAIAEALRPAPPLSATLLDGRSFTLHQVAGKVLIVNFWATWCAPCREEMPALEAFRSKHRGRGIEVLAISMDEPRNLAAVRSTLQAYGFEAALSAQTSYEGYGRIWRLPATFVVDREGRLRADLTMGAAPIDLNWLERHVTPLLGG